MKLLVVFLLGTFLFPFSSQARMYKWVDKDGKVHYTNTAPPYNAKTVYPSEETGGDPREREMRIKQERINEEVQTRIDRSANVQKPPAGESGPGTVQQTVPLQTNKEKKTGTNEEVSGTEIMTPAEKTGRKYTTITINDLESADSLSGPWPLKRPEPESSVSEPENKNEIRAPQEKGKYKIDPDAPLPDSNEIRKEIEWNYFQHGGGAG